MKSILIIFGICLLPCIKVHAQLPSNRPIAIDKFMAYNKNANTAPSVATPGSLPSEAKEYPERVREMLKLRPVGRTIAPELTSLPSTRKMDIEAISKRYKKI